MSNYRRSRDTGATFFFTVVAHARRRILTEPIMRDALHSAIVQVRRTYPFAIEAWVLLPDHMHAIWTLPEADADFGLRWGLIKRHVTRAVAATYAPSSGRSLSRSRRRESIIWQRRFWEHRIRSEADWSAHMDYLHFNPVKHGWAATVADWPYSTFHRWVAQGLYAPDWGAACNGLPKVDFD